MSTGTTAIGIRRRDERLLWLTFAFDTVFFAILAPLLPHYVRLAHLSGLMAGVLTGSFAAGAVLGSVPGAVLAAHANARVTIAAGVLTTTVASVVFGFSTEAVSLCVARLAQGIGSGLVWTGSLAWVVSETSAANRGEAIGRALAAAVVGQLAGPAFGAIGGIYGTRLVFSAIAAAGVALAVAVVRMAPGGAGGGALQWRELRPALADGPLLGAIWLVALPALLSGTLAVIAPLRLAALGFGASAIAVTWLMAAASEAALNPRIGRISDRIGRRRPLQAALVVAGCSSIAIPWIEDRWLLAAVVLLAAVSYGCLWVPAMTQLSHRTDQVGLPMGLGLALQSAWAPAHVAGTILLGGAIAEWLGRSAAFLLLTAICAITLCVAPLLIDHPANQGGHTRWA